MAEWEMTDEPVEAAARPAGEREICPEGERVFVIRAATEGAHRFKDGEWLMLRLGDAEGRFGMVFCDIPKDNSGAAAAAGLAKALGLGPFGSKVVLDPKDLEGREVVAEIYHRQKKTGGVFVNVRRFSAVMETDKPAPPKRTPKQKADAAAMNTDDIPF